MKAQNVPIKYTFRAWRGRLCCWPGNVQRWIQQNAGGELVVTAMPGVGPVPCKRLDYGAAERTMAAIQPKAISDILRAGFPVVLSRESIPAFALKLI